MVLGRDITVESDVEIRAVRVTYWLKLVIHEVVKLTAATLCQSPFSNQDPLEAECLRSLWLVDNPFHALAGLLNGHLFRIVIFSGLRYSSAGSSHPEGQETNSSSDVIMQETASVEVIGGVLVPCVCVVCVTSPSAAISASMLVNHKCKQMLLTPIKVKALAVAIAIAVSVDRCVITDLI